MFNGKELNEDLELDWYDFGARNYDASLGRWMNIDPLAEDFYSYSTYNAMMNDPISMVDPDGRAPVDWYKNESGDITWYDNDAEQFSNDNGNWENIGANEQEVKESLGIAGNTTFEFSSFEGMLFTGANAAGKAGGLPGIVAFDAGVNVSYDLEIGNTDNGKLVDGESQVTGINVNARVGVTTTAPGLKLYDNLTGDFSVNKKWTPSGQKNSFTSNNFSGLEGPVAYRGLSGGASGDASLTIPINQYKQITRNFSENPGGVRNMSINTRVAGKLLQNGQNKSFSISTQRKFVHKKL